MLRFSLVTALTLLAALGAASGALASQITHDGSVLTYTAAPGEANSTVITVNQYELLCDPVPAPCVSVFDYGLPISFPASLCAGSLGDVRCALPDSIVANLGDREDSWYDWDGSSTIDAGPGNDNPVTGNGGNDTLIGAGGGDNLVGGTGDDSLDGGPGDDFLEGIAYGAEADTQGRDSYRGGGGSDSLNFDGRSDSLAISPDGVADDGASGEGDNVGADIVYVMGGAGPDTMTGNSGRNAFDGGPGDDRISGAGGDDNLSGGSGNDRVDGADGQDVLGGEDGDDLLVGGPGVDSFWGDEIGGCIPGYCASGQDRIRARDGAVEKISCGPGTDAAEIDSADQVYGGDGSVDQCESVDGAGGPSGGKGDAVKRIRLRFAAPGAGLLRVRATARVAGKRIRVARASRRARRRGHVRLVLKPSAAALRALEAEGRLKVSVKATFRPRGGRTRPLARRTVTLR